LGRILAGKVSNPTTLTTLAPNPVVGSFLSVAANACLLNAALFLAVELGEFSDS
jgi:hypothetical protein